MSYSDNKRYYWLKLPKDFFESKRIKKLRRLGDKYVIIYLKMQLLSLETVGIIKYTGLEDSFAEELALDLDEDYEDVERVVSYSLMYGLLEEIETDVYRLPYVEDCTGSETQSARRKREYRMKDTSETSVGHCPPQDETDDGFIPQEKEIEKEIDIDINIYSRVIDYLNTKIGAHYRVTDKVRKLIHARVNEGFNTDDFIVVIDNKSSDWCGTDMEKYLRPETLFGNKFDNYLNQPTKEEKVEYDESVNPVYDEERFKELMKRRALSVN